MCVCASACIYKEQVVLISSKRNCTGNFTTTLTQQDASETVEKNIRESCSSLMAISLTLWMAMENPWFVYVLDEFPLEKRDFHHHVSACQAAQRKHCPMNDRPQIAGTQPSWATRMCGWCHEVPLLNLTAPCYRAAALDSASAVLAPDRQVISAAKCC